MTCYGIFYTINMQTLMEEEHSISYSLSLSQIQIEVQMNEVQET